MSARANDTMKHDVTETAAALLTVWSKARRFLEPQLGEDAADDLIRNDLDDAEELLADAVQKVEKAILVCTRRLRAEGRTDAQNSTGSHSLKQISAHGVQSCAAGSLLRSRVRPLLTEQNEAKQNPSSHGVKRRYDGVREHPTRPKDARQHSSHQRWLNASNAGVGVQSGNINSNRQPGVAGTLPVEMLAKIPQEHLVGMLESDITTAVRKGQRLVNKRSPDDWVPFIASVAAIERKERIQNLLSVLDPPVELPTFIIDKLSHEYILYEDGRGDLVMEALKREDPERHRERKKQLQDCFFATLPQDELTHEEQEFRAALMRYLDAWQESTPPFLLKALLPGSRLGNEIALARYMLMHPDVSVNDWIRQRIGADIEVTDVAVTIGPQFYRNTDSFCL